MEDPEILSGKLLLAVRMGEPTEKLLEALAAFSDSEVSTFLKDDARKKAFWINLYNAGFQILHKERGITGKGIYRIRQLAIGERKYSLDDIEHGILRRYRWKLSLGYLPQIFTPRYLKKQAVQQLDYRIHFALNCGAKSCPPIAYYSSEKIDEQLDWATQSFLEGETEIDEAAREIRTTPLFQWFLGDFGGKRGIRRILAKQIQVPTSGYRIVYKDYSWEEQLANFVDE